MNRNIQTREASGGHGQFFSRPTPLETFVTSRQHHQRCNSPARRRKGVLHEKKSECENQKLMPFKKPAAAGTIALLLLLPLAAWSGGVVTNCTEADLRAAMVGGGTVSFACDGTITLASTITNDIDITIDGTGHQVTVSGGNTVRVFFINPNVALTLINLSVANGHSPGVGMWPAEAGGILNLGNLNATSCTFRENFAEGQNGTYPDPGVTAHGGAILNLNGAKLNLSRCSFLMNRATGGHGAEGLDGSFASAPTGGSAGGPARGGAICNAGAMTIEASLFASNSVAGGSGGQGGNGNTVPYGTPATQAGGSGGSGGEGNGAVIFNADTSILVNCTFAFNSGNGGGGGLGGRAGHWETPHWAVGFSGGGGGDGGAAFGAISDEDSLTRALRMTNCTVAFNSASGGAGGAGGSGSINQPNGSPGSNGATGGGVNLNGGLLINVLLATNTPGGNCSGSFTDAGHNLSSDASGMFTNVGSMTNTDPKLGLLANNGGPTLTVALMPGSPAVDAGDNAAAPPTDQRGVPRPVGSSSDIGAYEFTAVLQISLAPESEVNVLVYGPSGQSCRLLTSTNLSDWQCVATNQIGPDGTVLFQDNCGFGESQRFYKVALP